MLAKLKEKAPDANVLQKDVLDYVSTEAYDYIFISSGSLSLFTDMDHCERILHKMKSLLKKGGKFVFAVDTVADKCPDDTEYKASISVMTKEGYTLLLKKKNYYDEKTHTQYSPGIYELYDGERLLRQESMDFQTHLYEPGEIEPYVRAVGFTKVKVYSSYEKKAAEDDLTEMLLYECSF